jgi:hypothetical protein
VETRQKEAADGAEESVLQKGADIEHVIFLGQPIGKQRIQYTLVSWTTNGSVGIDISKMEITKNKNP